MMLWHMRKHHKPKIIFLFRMKLGLRWMDKYSQKFREWVILSGYIGMGTGFVGLVVILVNWTEALPLLTSIYPILLLVLGIIIVSEILFWLMPKEKVKPNNIFWHTFKKKIENIFEVLMGLSVIAQVYILIKEAKLNITQEMGEGVLRWIGYIGVGIIALALIVGLFFIWIKLNSWKYKQ